MDQNWCNTIQYNTILHNTTVWAIATVIFSYTGSPQMKISQKVLGGATFLTHTVEKGLTFGGSSRPYAVAVPR